MLPAKYRLPLESGVKFYGRSQTFSAFTLIAADNQLAHPRFSVIIPRSVIQLSTRRHRLTRQLHGFFQRQAAHLPSLDILLIIKKNRSEEIIVGFSDFLNSLITNH